MMAELGGRRKKMTVDPAMEGAQLQLVHVGEDETSMKHGKLLRHQWGSTAVAGGGRVERRGGMATVARCAAWRRREREGEGGMEARVRPRGLGRGLLILLARHGRRMPDACGIIGVRVRARADRREVGRR